MSEQDSSLHGQDHSSHVIRSEDLLQGRREIQILHEGEVYRLLVTRNGKLILQK